MAVAPEMDSCASLVTGGYDCEFVDPPPESLQCPICLLPFRDPNLLSCCGHKGCASCLGRVKAAGHPCPLCQQPFIMLLDKSIQRKVLNLRVYCSKKREGCGWEEELRHLQTHSQRDCGYVEEKCRYKCGGRYQRRLLQIHQMDECPQRPPEVITQSLRKMAQRINKLEASNAKSAAAEDIHQEDKAQLSVLTSKLAVLEARCRYDQKKLAAVEKAHHEDQAKLLAVEKAHHEDQAKLAAVEKAHQKDDTILAALQSRLVAIERYHRIGQAKLVAVEKAHHVDQNQLSQQIQVLQTESASLHDVKRMATRKMEEFEGRLQQESKLTQSVASKLGPSWLMDSKGTLSSPYPPCQIVMPRFSQHKRDGDQWYSQPFYSAPGGYKLCLNVDASGFGSGAGTHVSVFVYLMKGENDERLEWPFHHDVTYRIINWRRDENHVVNTAKFKIADRQARVIFRERARNGYGKVQFLSHYSLCGDAGKQYLHEDCLCLQVVKVEPPR